MRHLPADLHYRSGKNNFRLLQVKPTEDVQEARDSIEALKGPEGSALSEPQIRKVKDADQRLAKPAAPGTQTPHKDTALSDVALQAGKHSASCRQQILNACWHPFSV